mmetsp:Transcript_56844/g.122941  ORF Transcript_56844/g.122941 Transcript_56844/m.122941 type:complete len:576 (-) Transcript_56844:241-1968(-)
MQPLAYFAVRSLLGWLQFVEREDRAFVSNALLLVATGAAHCWAVVYALFIAIHTRAMRYDGYHEGYTEHLPFWVSWTEGLSVASMGIWWAAGFTTAAIRIIDDDARGLPTDGRDIDVNIFFRIIRSPKLQDALALAHTVSCVGLFVSIILLCIAMALMKGSISACELCLCFVSVGFALPHAVVSCRRLQLPDKKKEDATVAAGPTQAAEAAAQEAAALGPQLCVILALADSPGHAFLWQNFIYLVSAIAFVAAVAACGRSPPKVGDAALPPDVGEFVACLSLDAAASLALVICFPHLNTWHLWALAALLAALFVAVWFEDWRDLIIDLLDPLLVVRSDTDKALPGQQRQRLRGAAWVATMLCAAVALWDILLHPVQEGLFETEADLGDHVLPDLWDQSAMLLLRWQGEEPDHQVLLKAAAESLDIETDKLATQAIFKQHRLLLFKFLGPPEQESSKAVHLRWKALVQSPQGELAKLKDSTHFPATLNVTLCLHAHAAVESGKTAEAGAEGSKPVMPVDFVNTVGPTADVQDAYIAACDWWMETLDSFYSTEGGEAQSGGGNKAPGSEEGDDLSTR